MTQGKSKRVPKGKKTGKQKIEPFAKKEWYDVKAPAPFKQATFSKTPINKSAGLKLAHEQLKGRVFEVSVGDLLGDQEQGHQLVRLRVEDVRGKTAYTVFHGLRFSNDKLRSLIKKWHTLLQATMDVKTTDGYILRVFAISFTKRRSLQVKKTCYAQGSQVARIVARMKDIINKSVTGMDVKDFTSALIHNTIGKKIEKVCSGIFPLQNTHIFKVKIVKSPKIDAAKIQQLHSDLAGSTTDVGTAQ
jgi:small subunit ribosomal protein S3Ae